MIKHIVMWKLKEEDAQVKQQQMEKTKEVLEALVGVIPGLITAKVEFDCLDNDYDLLLYSELESKQALADYQVHPEHQKIVEFIRSIVCGRACVDFEA